MHRGNENLKSIRVIMPLELYNELKGRCIDHGDISKLVRRLLKAYLGKSKGPIGTAQEIEADLSVLLPDGFDPNSNNE